jgi:glucokinase
LADDSPAAILVNIDGEIVKIGTEGGVVSVTVRDEDQLELLQKMLDVLQKIERHMSVMTEMSNGEEDQ